MTKSPNVTSDSPHCELIQRDGWLAYPEYIANLRFAGSGENSELQVKITVDDKMGAAAHIEFTPYIEDEYGNMLQELSLYPQPGKMPRECALVAKMLTTSEATNSAVSIRHSLVGGYRSAASKSSKSAPIFTAFDSFEVVAEGIALSNLRSSFIALHSPSARRKGSVQIGGFFSEDLAEKLSTEINEGRLRADLRVEVASLVCGIFAHNRELMDRVSQAVDGVIQDALEAFKENPDIADFYARRRSFVEAHRAENRSGAGRVAG
ncbi:MAG: hypothetical protein COV36_01125 [Alphaproteobacteria bacterium CG11_big_fil_rev_8_21_14_0_20_44_7]|nr:MAG: hypothetical protein COV36_01125 [Alphaproteobacteria bacterium CG11_big_fil_rev_8_21_14_0_20_44_7]